MNFKAENGSKDTVVSQAFGPAADDSGADALFEALKYLGRNARQLARWAS